MIFYFFFVKYSVFQFFFFINSNKSIQVRVQKNYFLEFKFDFGNTIKFFF